jgi:hypothetical protein
MNSLSKDNLDLGTIAKDEMNMRRPWWRKKRWLAAKMLWLVTVYVLLTGPILYAEACGFVPKDTYVVVFRPLYAAVSCIDAMVNFFDTPYDQVFRGLHVYTGWWADLAISRGTFRPVQLSRGT